MNSIEKKYMKGAFKCVLVACLLLHLLLSVIFAMNKYVILMVWSICSTLFYALMIVINSKEYFRVITIASHIEIMIFVAVSEVLFGWEYNFELYLAAAMSFVFFNPFKNKKKIFIISAVELIEFTALMIVTNYMQPIITGSEIFKSFMVYLNSLGSISYIVFGGTVSRITTERIEKSSFKVSHDELTGLYNRAYFFDRVEEELKSNPDKKYYMICTDISGFKLYNELFGEKQGNEVLLAQAEMMRQTSHIHGVYGRLSGDEFAMIVPEENYRNNNIDVYFRGLEKQFSSDQYNMQIYVGIYEIKDRTEEISSICEKAHIAIDSIKDRYDMHFAIYSDDMLQERINRRKLISEFDKALDNNQFCIYLQPQIDDKGEAIGAEALVRWLHPERGLVPPMEFIPVLEDTGLITKLDLYVWELAAKTLKRWKDEGKKDFYISVNVSGKDFYHTNIYKTFTELVEKYKIEPERLKIEITETVLMNEAKSQMDVLQKLRKYGFEIEMDDFGSGYSSLNMLMDIMLDVLKIDMGFLRKTENVDRSWNIIDTVIGLGKKLDMKIITEGVETEEQVNRLKSMGCGMFQGYFFSKPVPIEEFEEKYL